MKQLLILSGKGGTGKTTIASAFIKLARAKAYADCDVDAPNLHLIMGLESQPSRKDYCGLPKASIDPEKCIQCGKCADHCRFHAISSEPVYQVDLYSCEGCGVCQLVCPVDAVSMDRYVDGDLMLYKDQDAVFSTAQLKMGSGTSGLLVTEVKKQLIQEAEGAEFAIIDGSPGIGCPVIASISGVDLVLIVAEPSLSGISDMQRVLQTARKFGTKVALCVNKYDTNEKISATIKEYCVEQEIPFVGEIPFDPAAVQTINEGLTLVDIDSLSSKAVKNVFKNTMGLFLDQ